MFCNRVNIPLRLDIFILLDVRIKYVTRTSHWKCTTRLSMCDGIRQKWIRSL